MRSHLVGRTAGRTAILALALCLGCLGSAASPGLEPDPNARLRILFIGNSLTYFNDLPALVKALADSAGAAPVYAGAVAYPDYSLEDHWNEGTAAREIARGVWDYVVMQQGPSALEESRVLLLDYAGRFAGRIRVAGARPAMYMVWPSLSRSGDFDRVSESYRLAAESIQGLLLPAGDGWRAAWRRDASLPLYGPDGLHPSSYGTYLAALVIVQGITGKSPVGLPSRLSLGTGTRYDLPPAVALLLQEAAAEVAPPP
ncbi:MAG TPA: hypothetical protein VGQ17_04175 [Gemmatimonadales bacterium]|jgi:hypothetical protein|nr:hypothetical protein [Gemmatimonadales bacterium]